MKIFIYYLLAIFLWSCNYDINYTNSDGQVLSNSYKYLDLWHEKEELSQIYSDIKYIGLSKSADAESINSISNTFFIDSKIYVAGFNGQQVLNIYDASGSFIKQLDFSMLGTTKLRGIAIIPSKNSIYLGDINNSQTVYLLNMQGELINEFDIGFPFASFSYVPDKNIFVFEEISSIKEEGNYRTFNHLRILAEDFREVKKLDFELNKKYRAHWRQLSLSISDGNMYYNSPYSSIIEQISDDGSQKKLLEFGSFFNDENYLYYPIEKYLVNNNIVWIRRKILEKYYSFFIDLNTNENFFIRNAIPGSKFGDNFDFVFSPPKGVHNGSFYSYINTISFDKLIYHSEYPDNHRKRFSKYLNNTEFIIYIYDYNWDYWREHASHSMEEVFGPPSRKMANSPFSVKLYPNPTRHQITFKATSENLKADKTYLLTLRSENSLMETRNIRITNGEDIIEKFEWDNFNGHLGFIVISDDNGNMLNIERFSVFAE